MFSRRSNLAGPGNRISRAVARRRARGEGWTDLTRGNPSAVGLAWDEAHLLKALQQGDPSQYQPLPFGSLTARAHVCDYLRSELGHHTEPAHTVLTASTSEAYSLLFKLLCDPGDRVLAPTPSYPLFDALARLDGVELVPYPLRYDGRWHVDLPALREAAAHSRPRALLLVSPNNPTGSCTTATELSALAGLGLPVISDEVFAEYPLDDDARPASALQIADETLVFRMAGLSKSALLPQAKLAWTTVAGPPLQASTALKRLEHLADTYLSPNGFTQEALPALLAEAPALQRRVRERLRHNLTTLQRACRDTPLTPLHVEAGWYALVRLPAVMDEEEWVLTLLTRDGVRTQPGFFYDVPNGPHLVLSLLTPPEEFEQGVTTLIQRVHKETH